MAAFQFLLSLFTWRNLFVFLFGFGSGTYGVRSYRAYRRLSHIKGPTLAAWSNLWIVRAVYNLNTHQQLYDVTKKYGSLARIGPNMLLTSDADVIHLMNRARSPYTKSDWYLGIRIQPGHDNILSTIDETEHTRRRNQMAKGYSGKENPGVEARINHHISNLVKLIATKYISTEKESKPMDLARKAPFFSIDVITDLGFDEPFGDLTSDQDVHSYITSTEDTMRIVIMMCSVPTISAFINTPIIGNLLFPSSKDLAGPGRLIRVAEEVSRKRFAEDPTGTRKDMMGSFIRNGMKEDNAVTESLAQILAGADTTATAIRATMLFIMTNPRVYKRLQSDIDNFVKETNLPKDQIISNKSSETLPYLQAVIREGLRIWPPVTGLFPKVTPPKGDTINVIFIPGGTQIGYCAWGVHRNPDVFGEDADAFRPERWLESDGEKLANMKKTIELIFGYGKYQCLGRNISWMELNKIFFELLRRFEWCIVDPTKPWVSGNVGLWLQHDM
ncbi:hypothetical protein HYALB_00002912 [Hymenoscyphus albidus]|uniref:Cytochrome P450 monooxygenase ABA1 n=1 Tax=Hymenoscyphus albidus TaxID=595503 RepID=A0A9N9LX46_9HELO|nr:hypothetical protein HYALB_00002912 [Hymenoscyphus albidus]